MALALVECVYLFCRYNFVKTKNNEILLPQLCFYFNDVTLIPHTRILSFTFHIRNQISNKEHPFVDFSMHTGSNHMRCIFLVVVVVENPICRKPSNLSLVTSYLLASQMFTENENITKITSLWLWFCRVLYCCQFLIGNTSL